jgi:hypothetical protein
MEHKGQSAIEYLTTYGWMLLAVALIGVSIFAIISGQQSSKEVSGFAEDDLRVTDFGSTTDGNLSLSFRNWNPDSASIKYVNITADGKTTKISGTGNIERIEKGSVRLCSTSGNITASEAQIEVVYEENDITRSAKGELKGNINIEECTSQNNQNNNQGSGIFEVSVSSNNTGVEAGNKLWMNVKVENTGSAQATKGVTVNISGLDYEETDSTTLGAEETEKINFTHDTNTDENDTYTANISTPDDFITRSIEVSEDTTDDASGDSNTVTGYVSASPGISGVNVSVWNGNQYVVSDETNESGIFSLDTSQFDVNSSMVVASVEQDGGSPPFYAGAARNVTTVDTSGDFNFTFVDQFSDVEINGTDSNVSFNISERDQSYKHIANVEQLQAMNASLTSDYKLVKNIDASETQNWNNGKGFKPITGCNLVVGGSRPSCRTSKPFEGDLDGQGFSISSYTVKREMNGAALFTAVNGSEIEDLEISEAYVEGINGTAAILGVGFDGKIRKINLTGEVHGGYGVGGIAGLSRMETSYINADVGVEGNTSVGGIVGSLSAPVNEVDVKGNVNTSLRFGGGVAGLTFNTSISDSYSEARINSGGSYVGGLTGMLQGSNMIDSEMTGVVDAAGDSVGGLVGWATEVTSSSTPSNISASSFTGQEVSGNSKVGGVVGHLGTGGGSSLKTSYSITNVTASSEDVGGLVGLVQGDVNKTFTSSNVTGSSYVGGLVGKNGGEIYKSYSIGEVSGSSPTGGLAGILDGEIWDSYSAMKVSNVQDSGLVGAFSGTTQADSYWDEEVSNQSSSPVGFNLTTAQMYGNNASSNMEFDFNNIWEAVDESKSRFSNDSYPILRAIDEQTQLNAR